MSMRDITLLKKVMERTKLPTQHQIGDQVVVMFRADHSIPAEIMAIKFTDECVFYDVALFIISKDDSLPLRDVHSGFVYKPVHPAVESVHGLIHDACYELSQGNLEKVKDILQKADLLAHDAVEQLS